MLQQLRRMNEEETFRCVPVVGQALAARVQIAITSGLVDLNRCLKQATVRRLIVEQLIRMWRDAGHPDFQGISMDRVKGQLQKLAPTDKPTVPPDVLPLVEEGESEDDLYAGVDKAATPAERLVSEEALLRDMERSRPLVLVPQRDSDANKDVAQSRLHAWSQVSRLDICTSSDLQPQFCTSYIPRVFNLTLPRCVGGPDFRGQARYRRPCDAPRLSLDSFTSMISSRVEAQMRWDWDFIPSIWSLCFASKVNLGMTLAIRRALRRTGADEVSDRDIGAATAQIYKLLWEGEYQDGAGRRCKINGDVSKISNIVGLSSLQKAILQKYHYLSTKLSGTRQIRRAINHVIFSSRVIYRCPIFIDAEREAFRLMHPNDALSTQRSWHDEQLCCGLRTMDRFRRS